MILATTNNSADVLTGADRRANGVATSAWKPFIEQVGVGGPWGVTNWRYFIGNGAVVPDTPDGRGVWYWNDSDFTISGGSLQFRLVVNTFTNNVSNNANYTVGLWRVTGWSGSTPVIGNLVDSVVNNGYGVPVSQSIGEFIFAVSPSTPMNSGLQVHITAKIEVRWQ